MLVQFSAKAENSQTEAIMLFLEDALDQPTSSFWSDRRIRGMVEDLLRMRREAEAGKPPSLHDAYRAASHCARLLEALLSWAATKLGLRLSPEEWRRLPNAEKRALLARTLMLGLPILQPKACHELPLALEATNAGASPPLLQRKVGRRRRAPELAAYAELELLRWIRWQHGLGRKVADAEDEVARECRLTREAVQRWRSELPKVYGEHRVRRALQLAERVGRYERSGRTWTEINRRESDDNEMLCQAASGLERDLDTLIWMRGVAIAKRRLG